MRRMHPGNQQQMLPRVYVFSPDRCLRSPYAIYGRLFVSSPLFAGFKQPTFVGILSVRVVIDPPTLCWWQSFSSRNSRGDSTRTRVRVVFVRAAYTDVLLEVSRYSKLRQRVLRGGRDRGIGRGKKAVPEGVAA